VAKNAVTAGLMDHGSPDARLKEISVFLADQGIESSGTPRWNLHCYSDRLLLEDCQHPDKLTIQVDFSAGKMRWRRKQSERLHRALGINAERQPTIIDATAGLGQDAFVMAHQGSTVTLLEKNPLVYIILRDGIQQAATAGELAAQHMTAIHADAIPYLLNIKKSPQVIYLDPMFPQHRKSAKNKKEMQVLQTLAGNSNEAEGLLEVALEAAINRVVVKRPLKAVPYAGSKPDFAISGKNIRYDVYNKRAFS